jgi:hypothetical protein
VTVLDDDLVYSGALAPTAVNHCPASAEACGEENCSATHGKVWITQIYVFGSCVILRLGGAALADRSDQSYQWLEERCQVSQR